MNKWLRKLIIDPSIEERFEAMPKPTGSLEYDPWGFNSESAIRTLSMMKNVYENFFRVEAFGLENVPKEGRALIIANHSGYLPMDAGLLMYAIATSEEAPRICRAMVERFLPMVPFVGTQINELGAVVGDPVNCRKMLEAEEAIMVFPEGVRGTGKHYKQKYQLQRFGNGFLRLATETNSPIIPVGIVGCEESMPMAGNIKPLAKLANVPYVPIALPFPLPTKVYIHIGEPIVFEKGPETEEEATAMVDEVKEVIDDLIAQGLNKRKGIFR